MHIETAAILAAYFGLSSAMPMASYKTLPKRMLRGRQVPQEHSHEPIIVGCNEQLKSTNTANIQDCIFGLLGNAAASVGQGDITNTDCLHKATADQAFTNAKAAGDIEGMTVALIYASLERNTGSVGLRSVTCEDQMQNPEVQAIEQHQDAAADGAIAENKANTLILAQQIASIGGDPQRALEAGTFAPGEIGDPTAAGNTCNVLDDAAGCIFSQNLIVLDATAEEIDAAVAGVEAGAGAGAVVEEPAVAEPAAEEPAVEEPAAVEGGQANVDICPAPVVSTVTVVAGAQETGIGGGKGNDDKGKDDKDKDKKAKEEKDKKDKKDREEKDKKDKKDREEKDKKDKKDREEKDKKDREDKDKKDKDREEKDRKDQLTKVIPPVAIHTPPAAIVHTTPAAIHTPPVLVVPPPVAIHTPPAAIHTPPVLVIPPPAAVHPPPVVVHTTPAAIHTPPVLVIPPPAAIHTTPAAMHTPVVVIPPPVAVHTAPMVAPVAHPVAMMSRQNAPATGTNLQSFTGTLGGAAPPVISSAGNRPFSVNGSTFINAGAALIRSCDVQKNACANAANSGALAGGIAQCESQRAACAAAA